MARKRKWKDKKDDRMDGYEKVEADDLAAKAVGVGNLTRMFNVADSIGSPSVIIRKCFPYHGFVHGFALESGTAGLLHDTSEALDYPGDPPDKNTVLYPITVPAGDYVSQVYPDFLRLMSQGVGSNASVSYSALVRYTAHVIKIYTILYSVNVAYYYYNDFGWKSISPFTNDLPDAIASLGKNLNLSPGDFAAYWVPLMKRAERYILPPEMVREIKRLLSPKMFLRSGSRLMWPSCLSSFTDPDSIVDEVETYLDNLAAYGYQEHNYLASFYPFPLDTQMPWATNPVVLDPNYDTAWWNSAFLNVGAFGAANIPAIDGLVFDSSLITEAMIIHTNYAQPIWDEIKYMTFYESPGEDSDYKLVSIHQLGSGILLDDTATEYTFVGSQDDTEKKYEHFMNGRFLDTDIDYGVLNPLKYEATITRGTLKMLFRLQLQQDFGMSAVRSALNRAAGGYLREPRDVFKQIYNIK